MRGRALRRPETDEVVERQRVEWKGWEDLSGSEVRDGFAPHLWQKGKRTSDLRNPRSDRFKKTRNLPTTEVGYGVRGKTPDSGEGVEGTEDPGVGEEDSEEIKSKDKSETTPDDNQ